VEYRNIGSQYSLTKLVKKQFMNIKASFKDIEPQKTCQERIIYSAMKKLLKVTKKIHVNSDKLIEFFEKPASEF
jgi:hypothetical protein